MCTNDEPGQELMHERPGQAGAYARTMFQPVQVHIIVEFLF
jgi:hypothetical protein